MKPLNYISYTRVSTTKQGLGLEAQAGIIENYVANKGGSVIASYSDKASGKGLNRPGLMAAINEARAQHAILVVAKIDRLSRDVADTFALHKIKGLDIEVCDIGAFDSMMWGVFSALAQKERELISRRTREALAKLKEQGKRISRPEEDCRRHMREINHLGAEKRAAAATAAPENRHAWNAIRLMPGSLASKAAWLNAEGYTTTTGKAWTATAVMRLQKRYANI